MNNIYFETLDSTNTYLKQNHSKYNHLDVIIAKKQTSGRGRFDRVWESSDDLTFSILFKKRNDFHHIIAPLSIIKALEEFNYNALIKWPNDILLNEKKLAGILIETIINENSYVAIVGIGINLSKKSLDFTNYVNIERDKLLNSIEKWYLKFLEYNISDIFMLYKKYSFVLNKKIIYNNLEYEIVDFTLYGELVLKKNNDIIYLNASELTNLVQKIVK